MTVFDEFEKLKKTGLPQITVIFGEDNDIIDLLRDDLMAFIGFSNVNLSQAFFDLTDSAVSINTALEELESLPFFDDSRLVIFENLWDLTAVKKTVFDTQQMMRFETFIDNPTPTTQLILIIHGKLDARLKLTKKLKKVAVCLEARVLKPQELMKIFANEFSQPILHLIFEKSNFSFATIRQNITLVKTYANGRAVNIDDVERVVPKSLQDNIFDLTNFVFQKKIEAARELVHDLLLQGEDIIKILAILTNSYRLYTQVKLMQEKNWSESQMTEFLKIHPYRVKLANQAVVSLSKQYLKQSMRRLIQLDYQIKSGVADKEMLFDLLLIKLSAA